MQITDNLQKFIFNVFVLKFLISRSSNFSVQFDFEHTHKLLLLLSQLRQVTEANLIIVLITADQHLSVFREAEPPTIANNYRF
jgi:hypothetical protein